MSDLLRLLSRWFEFGRLAARNLAGYPLRSLLTTLGVVFGIASVVTMQALGAGAEEEILREIDRLGISNVILNSVKPPDDGKGATRNRWIPRYGITFEDLEQIEATVPGLRRALPVHSYSGRAWYGSRKEEVSVIGVTPEYFEATKLRIAQGRALTEQDERTRAPVCVVHLQLLRGLGYFGDPIGYRLKVDNQVYRVVGVLESDEFRGYARKALAAPERGDTEVYAPYSTVLTRIGTISVSRTAGSFSGSNVELNQVIVEVAKKEHVLVVARMLRTLLESSHEQRDYELIVPLELLEQRRQIQQVFNVSLLLIAGISLLVGGIGIANIMLATVTERTREIGVRRAIGAKRRHIVSQFLTETVALAVLGGVLGVLTGIAGVEILRWQTGWGLRFTMESAWVALVVSGMVGVISGMFPAWRASRLDPIQALRYE